MDNKGNRFGKYGTLISTISGLLLFVSFILAINIYFTNQLTSLSQDIVKVTDAEARLTDTYRNWEENYLSSATASSSTSARASSIATSGAAIGESLQALSTELTIIQNVNTAGPETPGKQAQDAWNLIVANWERAFESMSANPLPKFVPASTAVSDADSADVAADGTTTAEAEAIVATIDNEMLDTVSARIVATKGHFVALVQALEAETARISSRNNVLQIAGLALSVLVFLFIVFHFLGNLSGEDEAVTQARRETEEILNNVSEGLFLVNKDLIIGSEVSHRLTQMFRRDDFEDLAFENLLRDIVPDKVLTTAMDYARLLWSDRVNENLVKTLNPLDEVQVNFDDGSANFETLYLEFDFNRVMQKGVLSHLLVTVTDITQRVELSRELEQSQADSQAQLDLLLSILHLDPRILTTFLSSAEANMKLINATLKDPARTPDAFKEKLETIFSMVHSVKGDAAAIGLSTIEERAHSFEDMLVELRGNRSLTGNDFLPLAVRLDELMNHLVSVSAMIERLADFRQVAGEHASNDDRASADIGTGTIAIDAADTGAQKLVEEVAAADIANAAQLTADVANDADDDGPEEFDSATLTETLQSLVSKVAENQSKKAKLRVIGLDDVELPTDIQHPVRDIAIQMVRNAITHGLETPEQRIEAGKPETGIVQIKALRKDGFAVLTFADDGAGINENSIKATALENGLVSPDDIDDLTDKQLHKLIFTAGFSTQKEADKDAGRGVGLDLIRRRLREIDASIKISSKPGRGTAFAIAIPASPVARDASAA